MCQHVAFIYFRSCSFHFAFISSTSSFPPILVNTPAKNISIVSHGIYQPHGFEGTMALSLDATTSTCSSKPIPEAFTSVARDRITTIRWDGILMIMRLYGSIKKNRGLSHHSCRLDFKGVNHQQWEQTWDEWGSWPSHHHPPIIIWVWYTFDYGTHRINATLRDILRNIIYDTLMKKYFTSSGPHRDIMII